MVFVTGNLPSVAATTNVNLSSISQTPILLTQNNPESVSLFSNEAGWKKTKPTSGAIEETISREQKTNTKGNKKNLLVKRNNQSSLVTGELIIGSDKIKFTFKKTPGGMASITLLAW